jgi:hypothetical protein
MSQKPQIVSELCKTSECVPITDGHAPSIDTLSLLRTPSACFKAHRPSRRQSCRRDDHAACDGGSMLRRSAVRAVACRRLATSTPTYEAFAATAADGAVGTVGTPAVDGVAREPRGAGRHVTAPLLEAWPDRTSARTSSRTEPIGPGREVQRCQHVQGFQQTQVRAIRRSGREHTSQRIPRVGP